MELVGLYCRRYLHPGIAAVQDHETACIAHVQSPEAIEEFQGNASNEEVDLIAVIEFAFALLCRSLHDDDLPPLWHLRHLTILRNFLPTVSDHGRTHQRRLALRPRGGPHLLPRQPRLLQVPGQLYVRHAPDERTLIGD